MKNNKKDNKINNQIKLVRRVYDIKHGINILHIPHYKLDKKYKWDLIISPTSKYYNSFINFFGSSQVSFKTKKELLTYLNNYLNNYNINYQIKLTHHSSSYQYKEEIIDYYPSINKWELKNKYIWKTTETRKELIKEIDKTSTNYI